MSVAASRGAQEIPRRRRHVPPWHHPVAPCPNPSGLIPSLNARELERLGSGRLHQDPWRGQMDYGRIQCL
jgi:hypothetical protein